MSLEVEGVLLTQPELVVIIVQTLLGHAYGLGSLLQTHLLEITLALVQVSPLLHDLDHLEDHSLLAPFFFNRRGLTEFFTLLRG
jgi:hypothetical protein